MIAVLDASAAIEIALNKEWGEVFKDHLRVADVVIAPNTFPSEITNAFWKYNRFDALPIEKCGKGIDYCLDLVDDYIDTKDLCREVLGESTKRKHPAYDMFYLVLARRNDASLLTRDKKMMKMAKEMNIAVAAPRGPAGDRVPGSGG